MTATVLAMVLLPIGIHRERILRPDAARRAGGGAQARAVPVELDAERGLLH